MTSLAAAVAAGPVVLDGGLATLLEARGHDLSSALWSARLLLDDPGAVRDAHVEYFAAGAQVATTASYEVSASGFAAAGLDAAQADEALVRSVRLAREAVDAAASGPGPDRPRWVAASVGPYGASLADGSEYRGDHGLGVAALRRWHRPRLQALAAAGPDVLGLETLPSLAEVEALLAEVAGAGVPVWLSLTAAGGRTRAGEPLAEAFAMAADVPEVLAVGVNCCDPAEVGAAVALAAASGAPAVAYPNSGERWDAAARGWTGQPASALAGEWVAAGARLVGGCCRVGPRQVRRIAEALTAPAP